MCGIFGFALPSGNKIPEHMERAGLAALHTLDHRGPDSWGHEVIGSVFLGHTRLSIIDLSSAGRQPMVADDKLFAITVNGEIYNHRQIRDSLRGQSFHSQCDSEVVLHGVREFGLGKLLKLMDGMYASAVYDHGQRRVQLFRDRVGIKPLYYGTVRCSDQEVFAWSSELKAIKKFADDLVVDPSAILDFAAQRCIPAPKSLFKNIYKLKPAHYLSYNIENGFLSEHQYWHLPTHVEGQKEPHSLQAELREWVDQSVREQLVADVPVGLFLSGGLDSSVLCEAASRHTPNIRSFTIGFGIPERDETPHAKLVADAFSTEHTQEIVSPRDSEDLQSRMLEWFDEPFGDLSALPTARVSELTRKACTVALSGDGGDELFGGYRWYNRYWRYRRLNKLIPLSKNLNLPFHRPPSGIAQKIANRLALLGQLDPLQLYSGVCSNLLTAELETYRLWLEIPTDYDYVWALRPHYKPELGQFRALQYLDFHTWLPDDLLTKVDRTSMSYSLEVRVPFLKKELCEFAFSLPESFLYANNDLKGGLKAAYSDLLPEQILSREKQGFSLPVGYWDQDVLEGEPSFVLLMLKNLRKNGLQELAN